MGVARSVVVSPLLYLMLLGCSSSGGPPIGVEIGASGGEIADPSGAHLAVPAGALSDPVTLAVEAVTSGYSTLPIDATTLGSVFAFTPHGQSFSSAVTITVPFSGGSGATPRLLTSGPGGAWEEVADAIVVDKTIRVSLLHFSFFVVVEGGAGESPLDGSWRLTSKVCNGTPVDMTGWLATDFIITGATGRIVNDVCQIPVTFTYPSAGSLVWVIGENTCGGVGDIHTATYTVEGNTLTTTEELTPADEYGCPSGRQVSTLTR